MKSTPQVDPLSENDAFSRHMGFRIQEFVPGRTVVEMKIGLDHLSFMGFAHGGAVFALADAAFGLAANARQRASIGIDAHIAYTRSVRPGDILVAVAEEVSRGRRTAVYRVGVNRGDETVAALTGTVHVTNRPSPLA